MCFNLDLLSILDQLVHLGVSVNGSGRSFRGRKFDCIRQPFYDSTHLAIVRTAGSAAAALSAFPVLLGRFP